MSEKCTFLMEKRGKMFHVQLREHRILDLRNTKTKVPQDLLELQGNKVLSERMMQSEK